MFHFRFSGAVPVHHISQDMFLYEFSTRLCSASILYDTILILLDRLVIIANICCFYYLMLCLLDANQDNQKAPKITKFGEILSKFCNTFEAVESTIRTGRTKAFGEYGAFNCVSSSAQIYNDFAARAHGLRLPD